MSCVDQLQLLSEEWTPHSIIASFNRPSNGDPYTRDADSVELITPVFGLGWRFSLHTNRQLVSGKNILSRPAEKWTVGSSHFRPCPKQMRRSCEGALVMVEAFWTICKTCGASLKVETLTPASAAYNRPTCLCSHAPSQLTCIAASNAVLLAEDAPITIDLKGGAASPIQTVQLLLKVTMADSSKCGDFFAIRSNAAERSSQLATHDLTCVQKEKAGVWALGQSLKSGISFDAVFLAFTRRATNGRATEPQPIYANTSVLTAKSPSFNFLGPSDTETSLFAVRNGSTDTESETQHEIQTPIFEDYDYESDSDLDDEEVLSCEVSQTAPVVDEPSANENVAQNNDVPVLDVDDGSSLLAAEIENAESEVVRNPITTLTETDETTVVNAMCPLVERTVFVKNAAYRTWHALVFYCYTGQISFCDLRSQVGPGEQFSRPKHDDGSPPPCSPKSMYRLADKLGIEPLRALAFAAIEERLSQANILDESFSKFTSMFPEIREMEVTLLMDKRRAPEVLQAIPDKIRAVALGKMPHAAPVLGVFFEKMAMH